MADHDLKLPMHSRGWLALALAGIVACTAGSVWATANWFGAPNPHAPSASALAAADNVHALSRAEDDAMLARALRATALPPVLEARGPLVTRTIADAVSPSPARAHARRAHVRRGHRAQQARYTSAPAMASVDTSALR